MTSTPAADTLRAVVETDRRCTARQPTHRYQCELPDQHRGDHHAHTWRYDEPITWRNRRRSA